MLSKPILKIYFADFWSNFEPLNNPLYHALSLKYDIVITENNPDLLFYSVFGCHHNDFNCKRIFYTGENVRPNFKNCDFAFSFDYLDDNRNYRLPLYPFFDDVNKLLAPKDAIKILNDKKYFCNFIYSNPGQKFRNDFFKKLSGYKMVHSGGRFLNNLGYTVPDKKDFIKAFKFTIAFENSSYPGYTTEKIFEPMLMNSIPIYWGNPLIGYDFNTSSFLNYHDFQNDDELIEKIIEIDQNDELYLKMLSEPWFNSNQLNEYINPENILSQLEFIINSKEKPIALKKMSGSTNTTLKFIGRKSYSVNFQLKKFMSKLKNFSCYKLKKLF